MFSLLLAIVYLAFISLGLPDSLLGTAWPVMRVDLGVPISFAGIVSAIITLGTIVSSLLSDRLTRKLGVGLVTAISVLMTAAALLGFSFAGHFYMLCIFAIPYGLGAGAVDAALNNHVALHYASRHMSWLHCFWGVGAAISPYIMGFCLSGSAGFSGGYQTVSFIQIALTIILFAALPLWKKTDAKRKLSLKNIAESGEDNPPEALASGAGNIKNDGNITDKEEQPLPLSLRQTLKIRGLPLMLITFFAYCAAESTGYLWTSSYLVQAKGIAVETAAMFASFLYLGLMLGRFACGFISDRAGDKRLIRTGIIIMIIGVAVLAVPDKSNVCPIAGLIILGLGNAPVYPSIIHSAPANFGKNNSHAVIGVQMACAYIGSTLMPPLFGLVAQYINIALFPFYLLILITTALTMSELLNKKIKAPSLKTKAF